MQEPLLTKWGFDPSEEGLSEAWRHLFCLAFSWIQAFLGPSRSKMSKSRKLALHIIALLYLGSIALVGLPWPTSCLKVA